MASWEQHTITSLADVPARVRTFASALGMTVGGTSTVPTVTSAAGLVFTLTQSGNDLIWTCSNGSARIRSPIFDSGAKPPTKVILFGGLTPKPYLVIVIEYGYNLYRHLYLGNIEPSATFTGGEVISGSNFFSSNVSGDYPLSYRDNRLSYLFGAHQNQWDASSCGGARITHANNPTAWRLFRSARLTFGGWNQWDGNEIVGGFKDDYNDGLLARGRSGILVPVNLLAVKGTGSTAQFAHVGRPAGVRMVNMTDLDPDTTLTIGADEWQCFPAFKKSTATTVSRAAAYGADETSFMVGYAYRRA